MCPNSQELVEDIILESSHQAQSSRLVNLPGPNLIFQSQATGHFIGRKLGRKQSGSGPTRGGFGGSID